MRKIIGSVLIVAILGIGGTTLAGGSFDKSSCTFNGKKLYGKIKEVTIAPDVKVQVVTIAPDVRVQKVDIAPSSCGKWQMVTIGENTKVQFVTIAPDVKIQYVTIAPGAR